nr:AMP-binding protein [Pseudonocardia sp. H11422]
MRAHQRYCGENLPRDLAVGGSGALLHGVGINVKAFDLTLDFAGATGTLRNVAGGPPEDLGLTVTPLAAGELLLGFEVDARTNDQAAVDRRMASLVRMVTELSGSDAPAVGRVELMTPRERERVLADRAEPVFPLVGASVVDTPENVPGVLNRLVAEQPDVTALVCGPERLTTAELGERVHRLARALRARGIGPDDVVALALPRSVDLVVALLAVLDAGGAYLALDLEHPAGRLRELIADARPALVLGTAGAARDLGGDPPRTRRRRPTGGACGTVRGAPGPGRAGRAAPPGRPRLCPVHLGFDRSAEGRARTHGPRRQPHPVAAVVESYRESDD